VIEQPPDGARDGHAIVPFVLAQSGKPLQRINDLTVDLDLITSFAALASSTVRTAIPSLAGAAVRELGGHTPDHTGNTGNTHSSPPARHVPLPSQPSHRHTSPQAEAAQARHMAGRCNPLRPHPRVEGVQKIANSGKVPRERELATLQPSQKKKNYKTLT
jgi:hypothetical protein